jgi:SAM-dependent methyltransferase
MLWLSWRRTLAAKLERRMRSDWDARASEDYKLHIATGHSSSDEMFRESGRRDLETVILDGIDLDPSGIGLEIGCGVGRLLVPLSERIAMVRGVDISLVMVEKSREYCAGRKNVRVELTDGSLRTIQSRSIDFAFSFIVFQHIPDRAPIQAYVREVARCLRQGGLFRFQIDGRWERFRDRPPDTYEGVKLSPATGKNDIAVSPKGNFIIRRSPKLRHAATAERW